MNRRGKKISKKKATSHFHDFACYDFDLFIFPPFSLLFPLVMILYLRNQGKKKRVRLKIEVQKS